MMPWGAEGVAMASTRYLRTSANQVTTESTSEATDWKLTVRSLMAFCEASEAGVRVEALASICLVSGAFKVTEGLLKFRPVPRAPPEVRLNFLPTTLTRGVKRVDAALMRSIQAPSAPLHSLGIVKSGQPSFLHPNRRLGSREVGVSSTGLAAFAHHRRTSSK